MRHAQVLGVVGVGDRPTRRTRIEFADGTTLAQLASSMPCPVRFYWGGVELIDHDAEAPAGLVVLPSVAEPTTLFIISIVVGIVSAAVSGYLAQSAAKAALRDSRGQDSDDSGSANFRAAQSTRYGRGWAIPIVFGRWRVSGQVIDIGVVRALGISGQPGEYMHILLALCEGRIARIGDMDGGMLGEADELGSLDQNATGPRAIPTGLRVDGVDLTSNGTEVSIRMGSDSQSRIPKWPFALTTEQIGAELNEQYDQKVVTVEQVADQLWIALEFPAGLYRRNGQGISSYDVHFRVEIRKVGSELWVSAGGLGIFVAPRQREFTYNTAIAGLDPTVTYQVRFTRLTASGDPSQVSSQCVWVSTTAVQYQKLTYPGCALLSLSRSGSAASESQRSQLSAQVDGLLVRGWDAVTGWTARTWDAISPWSFPLGRNPSWAAVELMTNRDLGVANELILWLGGTGEEEIDLPAFRNWADFCDVVDPSDPLRAHLEFNHAIDVSRPAMEWLMAIFQAGHATPILEGGRLSVTYEYRDAHGRGTNSVPAREAYQILSTTNVESCELVFRDPSSLPNILEVEFFDEEQDYIADVVTVSDEARLAATYLGDIPRVIVQKLSAIGPTSREAARREAWYQLQWMTSLVEARLKGGLALATITVGDLFWLQHDCWSPSNPDGFTGAMRTLTDSPGSDVTSITLDRVLVSESPARSGTGLFVADLAGRARLFTIDGTGQYAVGDSIPLWDPVTGAPPTGFRCRRDATVAYGQFGTFERRMKVTSMSTDPTYRVEIQAAEWPEQAFDAPPEELTTDDGATIADPLSVADAMPEARALSPRVLVEPGPALSIGSRGEPVIGWQAEPTTDAQTTTGAVRVFARAEDADRGWDLLAQTRGSSVLADELEVGRWHEVAVLRPRLDGGYPDPGDATPALVLRPELWGDLLPAPGGLAAAVDGLDVSLVWRAVAGAARYVVRRGGSWIEATTLATPTAPAAALTLGPGTHRLMVRAELPSGRWGEQAELSVVVAEPIAEIDSLVELPTVAGSHDGTEIVDGTLRLVSGVTRGVYTAPALAGAGKAALSWSAIVDGDALEVETIGEDSGRIGDDWGAQVGGRRATDLQRGSSGAQIGDDTGTIGEWSHQEIRQGISGIGSRATVSLEARWHDGSTWSSWVPWSGSPTRREAEQIQVRATLQRQHTGWRVAVDAIEVRASA